MNVVSSSFQTALIQSPIDRSIDETPEEHRQKVRRVRGSGPFSEKVFKILYPLTEKYRKTRKTQPAPLHAIFFSIPQDSKGGDS